MQRTTPCSPLPRRKTASALLDDLLQSYLRLSQDIPLAWEMQVHAAIQAQDDLLLREANELASLWVRARCRAKRTRISMEIFHGLSV